MPAPNEKEQAASSRHARGASSTRGRIWRYGPLLLWIAVICFASTGNLSASNTFRVVRPVLIWLFPNITRASLRRAHFLIRKAAHFTEYATLALLAARAFLCSTHPSLRRRWWLHAFVLVAACALLDEYHQSFVPTRTSTIYDSLLDMTGGACALAVVTLWRCLAPRADSEHTEK
jgi:VanZ family protein